MFRIKLGAAKGALIRAAASTQPFGYEVMKMEETTFISKTHEQTFLLDKGKLRKIIDTLSQHMQKRDVDYEIIYEVKRVNNSELKTKVIEDILGDDNTKGKEIRTLSIKVNEKPKGSPHWPYTLQDKCKVTFKTPEYSYENTAVQYSINDQNKGWCLLLGEDLETQINRALVSHNKGLITVLTSMDMIFPLILICFALWIIGRVLHNSPLKEIDKMSLEEKINEILVLERSSIFHKMPISHLLAWVIGIVTTIGIAIGIFQQFEPFTRLSKWFDKSVFYWGDQIILYDKHRALTQNIKWVIVYRIHRFCSLWNPRCGFSEIVVRQDSSYFRRAEPNNALQVRAR
jgi:hypothetical protein